MAAKTANLTFEIGEECKITMVDPADRGALLYIHGTVVEFQFPLLKLRLDNQKNGNTIYNLTASVIVGGAEQRT